MSRQIFFVRSEGRITGPFAGGDLHRFIRDGTLHRTSEISLDRKRWHPAGAIPKLFAKWGESPAAAASSASPLAQYNYQHNDVAYGPFTMDQLQRLAYDGQLHPDDLIWQTGDAMSLQASRLPALAPFLNTSPAIAQARRDYAAEFNDLENQYQPEYRPAPARKRSPILAPVTGIGAGSAFLLLSMLLPWGNVRGEPLWLWLFLPQNGPARDADLVKTGVLLGLCAYFVIGGLALLLFSGMARAATRGAAFMVIAGFGFCIEAVFPMLFPGDVPKAFVGNSNIALAALGIVAGMIAPLGAACLVAIAHHRERSPDSENGGRGLQAGIGVCTAISGSISFIILILQLLEKNFYAQPGAVAFIFVIRLAANVGMVAAGIFAARSGYARAFEDARNTVSRVVALYALGFALLAAFIQLVTSEGRELLSGRGAFPGSAPPLNDLSIAGGMILLAAYVPIFAVGLFEYLRASRKRGAAGSGKVSMQAA